MFNNQLSVFSMILFYFAENCRHRVSNSYSLQCTKRVLNCSIRSSESLHVKIYVIHDMHIDVTDPNWVANGSIMADTSCEALGEPSSGTWITHLEYEKYENCPENQRRR